MWHATEPVVTDRAGLTWLSYRELDMPGFFHGMVVCRHLPQDAGCDRRVEAAVRAVADTGPEPGRTLIPDQVHSDRVRRVGPGTPLPLECDGLVTAHPGVMIGVSVADCVPVFAVDPGRLVIGVAHCGWRGTAGGVVGALVREMDGAGADLADTRFVLGASIGQCCYEVRQDLLDGFRAAEAEAFSVQAEGRIYFDLKSTAASRLVDHGAVPENISIDKTCTSCEKYRLSSYRGSGSACGHMLAVLKIVT